MRNQFFFPAVDPFSPKTAELSHPLSRGFSVESPGTAESPPPWLKDRPGGARASWTPGETASRCCRSGSRPTCISSLASPGTVTRLRRVGWVCAGVWGWQKWCTVCAGEPPSFCCGTLHCRAQCEHACICTQHADPRLHPMCTYKCFGTHRLAQTHNFGTTTKPTCAHSQTHMFS